MSGKGSKRRHRRVNTIDEEPEKKPDEIIDVSDDNKSTISTDTEKTEKDTSLKETPEVTETKKENVGQAPSPKKKDSLETIENGQPEPPKPETTNGQPSENGISISTTTTEPPNPLDDTSDIEPLVLEESEDPELQFPSETGSETSEIEKSPVLLNRCKTRRSQTRNLPTPKTPKALDYNGEEEIKNPGKELRVNVTRLLPTPEVEEPEINEEFSIISNDNMSVESSSFSEKTQDTDLTNASVFVNLGDTTRNIDITTTSSNDDDDSTINASNFLDSTKDKTYGETLRCLSGRRTLRSNYSDNYKSRFYASNIDLTDSSKTYSPIKIGGTKRKFESDSPGEQKKAKIDPSPGLFSYISSPFKPKVGRTEIPSSTPKLTSFKYVHQGSNQIDEVQKVGMEYGEEKKGEPKKWCSIM